MFFFFFFKVYQNCYWPEINDENIIEKEPNERHGE